MRLPRIRRHSATFGFIVAASLVLAPVAASAQAIVGIDDLGPGEVCFTSGNHSTEGGDCAALVAEAIAGASASLLVQAYNFTESRIVAALLEAHRRGVSVTVVTGSFNFSASAQCCNAENLLIVHSTALAAAYAANFARRKAVSEALAAADR